jgi:DNA (cytosine-5)-methyltransferase 1
MPDIQNSPASGKTIGSLFAGIGGFDLGFERAGFKTTWACEIDQKAQAVLRLRFPDAKLHDDVCAVGSHNLEPVDVVTFGSPCQDLSVAGKRAGLAGERSGLFHEAARIIRELRAAHGKPDFAIWENVPGAFSSNGGRDFAAVVQAMVDLGARDVAWRVLDSRFFGVAQRRRRVFLVADFGGERAEQVLALTEGVRGYSPKGRQARQGSTPGAGYSPATSGSQEWPARLSCTLNTAFGTKMGLEDQHALAGASMFVPDISATITSKWAKGSGGFAGDETANLTTFEAPRTGEFIESDVAGTMTAQSGGLGETRNPAFVLKSSTYGFCANEGSHGMGDNREVSPAIKISTPAVAFNWQEGPSGDLGMSDADTGGSPPVRVSQTLAVAHEVAGTLGGGSGQRGWSNDLDRNGAFIPESTSVVRRLTPVECCRLQGFPDDWNSEGIDAKGKRFSMADAPRYRQLGNAVTVNVANWIANNLVKAYDVAE